MTQIDPDDLDAETLSLCQACAKHASLKRFVLEHGRPDLRCGVCLNASPDPVTCDLEQRQQLTYLIRALLRFYFSEDTFNSYWGADQSAVSIMQSDNPVIESEPAPGYLRSSERSWVYLEDVLDNEVYPPYDEGVAVFAGFGSEGDRGFNRSLQTADSRLHRFRDRLKSENYFHVEPDLTALIKQVEDRIAVAEPAGQVYYRARLGVQARYLRQDGFSGEIVYQPHQASALGSPPPHLARAGRLNREGVSFLYLASDIETACAEIRPHPSHQISVGEYRSLRPLRLANLEADIAGFASSDTQLDLYAFIYAADQAMSLPVRPEEVSGYSITQLIADVLRQHGFDGVAFKSSLAEGGRNVCIFKPEDFKYIGGSAVVRQVERLRYDLSEPESVSEPDAGDMPLP